VVDQQNPNRILVGSDGGFYVSYDRGKTADHYMNIPVGEFYAIEADMADPYNVYGGMQDHDSWKGPSNSWSGEVNVADWITVGTGDGMYNRVDPTDARWLYNTSQFGDHKRVDQAQRTMTDIMPRRPKDQPALRWNWNTPLVLSPHNPQILYTGAQVLFGRSTAATPGRRRAPTSRRTTKRRRSAGATSSSARSRPSPSRPSRRASSGWAPTTAGCR